MPHFTKRLETSKGPFIFHFNRIFTAGGVHYHISFIDKNRKSQAFNMSEDGGKWTFVNPDNLPDWMVTIEAKLGNVITEHLRASQP
jgi:hypothetical protein